MLTRARFACSVEAKKSHQLILLKGIPIDRKRKRRMSNALSDVTDSSSVNEVVNFRDNPKERKLRRKNSCSLHFSKDASKLSAGSLKLAERKRKRSDKLHGIKASYDSADTRYERVDAIVAEHPFVLENEKVHSGSEKVSTSSELDKIVASDSKNGFKISPPNPKAICSSVCSRSSPEVEIISERIPEVTIVGETILRKDNRNKRVRQVKKHVRGELFGNHSTYKIARNSEKIREEENSGKEKQLVANSRMVSLDAKSPTDLAQDQIEGVENTKDTGCCNLTETKRTGLASERLIQFPEKILLRSKDVLGCEKKISKVEAVVVAPKAESTCSSFVSVKDDGGTEEASTSETSVVAAKSHCECEIDAEVEIAKAMSTSDEKLIHEFGNEVDLFRPGGLNPSILSEDDVKTSIILDQLATDQQCHHSSTVCEKDEVATLSSFCIGPKTTAKINSDPDCNQYLNDEEVREIPKPILSSFHSQKLTESPHPDAGSVKYAKEISFSSELTEQPVKSHSSLHSENLDGNKSAEESLSDSDFISTCSSEVVAVINKSTCEVILPSPIFAEEGPFECNQSPSTEDTLELPNMDDSPCQPVGRQLSLMEQDCDNDTHSAVVCTYTPNSHDRPTFEDKAPGGQQTIADVNLSKKQNRNEVGVKIIDTTMEKNIEASSQSNEAGPKFKPSTTIGDCKSDSNASLTVQVKHCPVPHDGTTSGLTRLPSAVLVPSKLRKIQDMASAQSYKCPRCPRSYQLLHPYKHHLLKCCPQAIPPGLPLTRDEMRGKYRILSSENVAKAIGSYQSKSSSLTANEEFKKLESDVVFVGVKSGKSSVKNPSSPTCLKSSSDLCLSKSCLTSSTIRSPDHDPGMEAANDSVDLICLNESSSSSSEPEMIFECITVADNSNTRRREAAESAKSQSTDQDGDIMGSTIDSENLMDMFESWCERNSFPPVSFAAKYPDETPEENLAYVILSLEFNQPGGAFFKNRHQLIKRLMRSHNQGVQPVPQNPQMDLRNTGLSTEKIPLHAHTGASKLPSRQVAQLENNSRAKGCSGSQHSLGSLPCRYNANSCSDFYSGPTSSTATAPAHFWNFMLG